MAKKITKTAAPSGCTITRNGNKFTLSWKINAKNSKDGQKRRWRRYDWKKKKWSDWFTASIGKKATQTTIETTAANISSVTMQVQDNQDKDGKSVKDLSASSWAGATFKLYKPPASICSMTLDNSIWNQCLVSWGHDGDDFTSSDHYWYQRTEYQTTFHSEKEKDTWWDKDGNKGKWTKVSQSNSFNKKENSITISSDLAYVRKYRFRILGKAGYNKPAVCSHYYSTPYKAIVKSARLSGTKSGGMNCRVTWYSGSDTFHPIDYTTLQYGIAVPGANMSCPQDISWTDRPSMLDRSGKDKQDGDSFYIDTTMDTDQCLFVRVLNIHDFNTSYSTPKLATGIITELTTPGDFSIDPNYDTCRVSVNITNESAVPDAKIAIKFIGVKNGVKDEKIIGIISRTDSIPKTIQCPDFDNYDEWSLGAYAFVGDTTFENVSYTKGSYTYTYTVYEIPDPLMESQVLYQGGDVPKAPQEVVVSSPKEGVALVTWDWAWQSADTAELSWSDHDDAWESTDQPETYRIINTHAAKWSIYGLETGMTWYIRVRLIKTTANGENPSPWSDIKALDMSSAPNVPILTCSKRSVTHDGTFTVSWDYESTDGTDQQDAVLISASLTDEGEVIYGNEIRPSLGTGRSVDLIPDNIEGWTSGNKYGFALKVISESGQHSDWSDPVFITIAEPLTCSITSSSFEKRYLYFLTSDTEVEEDSTYYTLEGTVVSSPSIDDISTYYELNDGVYSLTSDGIIDTEKTYYTVTGTVVQDTVSISGYYERTELNILREMPIELSASVSGGFDGSYYSVVSVDRASAYFVERPDENIYSGYEGETVYSSSIEDTSNITIEQTDMIGYLDDTAAYILTVLVYDDLDQIAEDSVLFYVNWEHQASIPGATVEFDPNYSVVKITPTIDPNKYEEGDTFDIYRLSVDKPVLIVKGGTFGQTYVDPYPTIGRFGGHRVVTVTANGDFISNEAESDMAWIDLGIEDGDIFNTDFPIINYGEGSYEILYNVDLSTQWNKDFRETRYLGGHIQGDWNAGVSRSSTINSVIIREEDTEAITSFRRLAEYPGVCHVRTLDGSNYYADVQVSETIPSDENPLNSYSFKITRVDVDGYDGIELSEWNKIISG